MAKKCLAIVLAMMFMFSFALVASAAEAVCLCPPGANCAESCHCVETGRCVCPTEEHCTGNVWKIILGVVTGIATIAVLFFGTRLLGCMIFC